MPCAFIYDVTFEIIFQIDKLVQTSNEVRIEKLFLWKKINRKN